MIQLKDGYFIDADEMNYTLRRRLVGKKKTGEEYARDVVIGYCSSVQSALELLIKDEQREIVASTNFSDIKDAVAALNAKADEIKSLVTV